MSTWMIYGANGYTGRLILDEAIRRGHKPIVAGRNAAAVNDIARRFGLQARTFALEEPQAAAAALAGVGLVLHCAGPFSATCAPMLEACLGARAHYLDITGEIDVFAHCHAQDRRARDRDIAVIPGSGFDVVPTDCLAALLQRELPDATELVLAFEAGGGVSPGTAMTSIEGLGKGGRIRRNGALVGVPLAYKDRVFMRDGKPRSAMTIPWGDVYTAHVSTGIAGIEVYLCVPPAAIRNARRLRLVQPLLRRGFVQRWMKSRVRKSVSGPDESRRGSTGCHIWGEVRNAAGVERKLELDTPNGYDVTAWGALGIVEHLLGGARASGYYTPSLLMGAAFILRMPGVRFAADRSA